MFVELDYDKIVSRAKTIFGWAIDDMIAEQEQNFNSEFSYLREQAKKKLPILQNLKIDNYARVFYKNKEIFSLHRYDGISEVEDKLETLFPFLYEVE